MIPVGGLFVRLALVKEMNGIRIDIEISIAKESAFVLEECRRTLQLAQRICEK